ncbi:MAG: beta-lactamase family protein [Ruminococcaceae bacterium]|nr:beta-lactamase family protein [Oscillospiraceae bacterium]
MKIGTIDPVLLEENLKNRINEDIDAQRISGAVVAVLQRGKIIFRGAMGKKTPGQSQKMTEDAIFRIASMTKPVTAVAALILAQRGKLKLDDPVSKYLPAYAGLKVGAEEVPCTEPLRVWHLLTHTSGMEADMEAKLWVKAIPPERQRTIAEAMDVYLERPLAFQPGAQRKYSGRAAFDILGRIIEMTAGVDFATFIQREICEPCGMVDTTFAPSAEQWQRVVGMHDYQDGCGILSQTTPGCVVDRVPITHPLGGSGLVSTIDDYIRFAEMLQNRGMGGDKRILEERWIDEMRRPQLDPTLMNEKVNQGLGVRVIAGEKYPWLPVGSFGWSGVYGTHFWVDPVNGITAIYMKNSRYDGGSGALTGKHFEEDVFRAII